MVFHLFKWILYYLCRNKVMGLIESKQRQSSYIWMIGCTSAFWSLHCSYQNLTNYPRHFLEIRLYCKIFDPVLRWIPSCKNSSFCLTPCVPHGLSLMQRNYRTKISFARITSSHSILSCMRTCACACAHTYTYIKQIF